MRVLCAPDSFKESISAHEAARAMAAGVLAAGADADVCPIADGGEGTLDALVGALGGSIHQATVVGPLGEAHTARFGISPDGSTGIVELAEASGMTLVPAEQRDPTRTTTFGTGQLIRTAAEAGCRVVLVAVGGSATCDGGTGLAQALGTRFFDRRGQLIERPMTGGLLTELSRIEPAPPLPAIRVACDVTNPLLGPQGAAAVFAPQKGATPMQVRQLDEGLRRLASLLAADPETPGAGAAGGAAFGLLALCGATLERGVDLVLDTVGFADRCGEADLVLTGEGRLDGQTVHGKAVSGVAARAHALGVPTVAIAGSLGPGADDSLNPALGGYLADVVSLVERFGRDRALREPAELISIVAHELVDRLQQGISATTTR
jgi:glycerate kinase